MGEYDEVDDYDDDMPTLRQVSFVSRETYPSNFSRSAKLWPPPTTTLTTTANKRLHRAAQHQTGNSLTLCLRDNVTVKQWSDTPCRLYDILYSIYEDGRLCWTNLRMALLVSMWLNGVSVHRRRCCQRKRVCVFVV